MSHKIHDGLTKNQRYYRNRGHLLEKSRAKSWRDRNPEKVREFNQRSYWKNRAKRLQYKREKQAYRNGREKANAEHKSKDLNRKHLRRTIGPGVSREQWETIKRAYGYRCAYCGCEHLPLTMDHVIPVSKGGLHESGNIVPACRSCNSSKGARCGC